MKKVLISGVLTGLVVFILLAAVSPSYSTDFPRHKNPAQIQEETFFSLQLISLYGQVVSLQVAGKWDLASSQLKKAFLSYIPEPVRYIFTRFSQLIQVAGDKLKVVQENIDSAQGLLGQGEIERAGETLEEAWMMLLKAERDLDSLDVSVDELRGKLGTGVAEKLREKMHSWKHN